MPSRPYQTVTAAAYSVKRTDNVLLVDTTSNAVTVTLPDASGRRDPLTITRIAGTNTLTVDTFDTDTIDGQNSITLTANNSSVVIQPQKDKYHVVSSSGTVNVGGKTSAAYLVGSKTHDFAATAATQGASVTTTVTVTGAVTGDPVVVSHTAFDGSQAAVLWGAVSAADTVTVRLTNTTAAAVDLASGTLKAVVIK
jgi:hypothetical protein